MPKPQNRYEKYFIILWLIPLIVLGYIGWMNFLPLGGILTYSLDVGGEDTQGKAILTGPFYRISNKKETNGINYRNIENNLVYFELTDPKLNDADEIDIRIRFSGNFTDDMKLMLGAKDKEEWSYSWKECYVPLYEKLTNLSLLVKWENSSAYFTKQADGFNYQSEDDFLDNVPIGSVIATNDDEVIHRNSQVELTGINKSQFTDSMIYPGATQEIDHLIINNTIRGAHTFWTYVNNDTLVLKITKQDLNWYEKPDNLMIKVFSYDDELEGTANILDDGNESNNKVLGPLQSEQLIVEGLKPGSYRIELQDGSDLLIQQIEVNQAKLVVADSVYLVGNNPTYSSNSSILNPIVLFTKSFKTQTMNFYTWHENGLQQVNLNNNSTNSQIDINQVKTDFSTGLSPGEYKLVIPKQDIKVSINGYFSFTPESFFVPQRYKVTDLKSDFSWLIDNVDYVIVNYGGYIFPIEDNNWLIAAVSWKTKGLYINKDKLSFCFNIPNLKDHLDELISIDWIHISIKMNPVFKR